MGSVHGTLTISFDDDGISDANREVDKFKNKFEKLSGDLDKSSSGISSVWMSISKSIGIAALALGALGGGIQLIAGLSSAVAALAGAVAILPGAFAMLGVVIGVLVLAKDGFAELGKELSDLKPKFDQLKLEVQQKLFEGLGKEIRGLANQYLPTLRTGLKDVAITLNSAAFELTAFLKEAQTQRDVAQLFNLTFQSVNNLKMAIQPLLSAFRDIGIVGASVFEQITRNVGTAAEQFAAWIADLRGSGEMEQWMLGGVEAVKQLVQFFLILGGILNQVFTAFEAAGGDFLGTLVSMASAVAQFFSSIEGQQILTEFATALKSIASTVGTFLLESLRELTPAILAALPAFAKLITALADMLLPAIETLAPAIKNIAEFIGQNADAVAGVLVAFGLLVAAFKVAAIAAGILNAILLANPYVLLAAAIVALVAFIILYWDEIVAFLAKTWNYIKDLAGRIWGSITEFFSSVWDKVVEIFKKIWPLLLGIMTGGIGLLVGLIIKNWDEIVAVTQSVWNSIIDFFKMIGQALYDTFVQPLINLAMFVGSIWVRIVSEVMTFLSPIIEIVRGIFDILYTIVSTIIELIWLVIQKAWMNIQETTMAVWNAITGFLSGIWNSISETASNVWNYIMAVVDVVWTYIVNLFHSLFDPIIAWWTGLWESVKNAITTANQAIGDFVSRKWEEIKNFIISIFSPIVQWFRELWNNVSNATGDGVNSVMNFIRGLPGQIWAAVSGAGSWLYQTGKDLIMGFLNGVRDMVGRAVAEVKRMANDVIAGAKSILGISSPSKVFKLFGEYTMEGYIVGVQSMFNPVMDTMAAVASNIAERGQVPPVTVNPVISGITSSVSGGDSTSSMARGLVIEGDLHLHVAGNLDPSNPVQFRETMKRIRTELTTVDREDS